MTTNTIPETLVDFRVYQDGSKDLLGIADVALPDLEPMNTSIKGAGILGEVSAPVIGNFGAMTMTLNFRTINNDLLSVFGKAGPHSLDLRGALQMQNASTGTRRILAVRLAVIGTVKKTGLGKLAKGEGNESSVELELTRIVIFLDGVEKFLLDKLNFQYRVAGRDQLSDISRALGI